jgi:hypothetical protein
MAAVQSNQILASLSADQLQRLAPHLHSVSLPAGEAGLQFSIVVLRRGNLWVTRTFRIAARTSACARGEDNGA